VAAPPIRRPAAAMRHTPSTQPSCNAGSHEKELIAICCCCSKSATCAVAVQLAPQAAATLQWQHCVLQLSSTNRQAYASTLLLPASTGWDAWRCRSLQGPRSAELLCPATAADTALAGCLRALQAQQTPWDLQLGCGAAATAAQLALMPQDVTGLLPPAEPRPLTGTASATTALTGAHPGSGGQQQATLLEHEFQLHRRS